jgi:flagellar protein FlaI
LDSTHVIDKQHSVVTQYPLDVQGLPVRVTITEEPGLYTKKYFLHVAGISHAVELVLEEIKEELITRVPIHDLHVQEIDKPLSPVLQKAVDELLVMYFPATNEKERLLLRSYLLLRVIGMEYVDLLLRDERLEEIAIDNAKENVWVYHREFGWLQTNVAFTEEEQIHRMASRIGRAIGREINTLHPLLDATLGTGERVNATLQPVSSKGNTITLRKFSSDPWTITKLIENGTMDKEAAAIIWQAMQYELSMLVVGGTASGKTSMLNALANFIPPNQRIISIEDTRELQLASFLYWLPMQTRLANSEGLGEISMEDLLVNSLRMRPDRILVGEVRRKREAETMFEAIHTGHSCYGTFHANNAREAVARLSNPPVSVPKSLLPAINLLLVQFRNRRTGKRRTFEIAELTEDGEHRSVYQYNAKTDKLEKKSEFDRITKELSLFTGFTEQELVQDRKEKELILQRMIEAKIFNIEQVGRIMAEYYRKKAAEDKN